MASLKPLMGVIGVGSISTAGVFVANQYGLFSTSSQATRENIVEWVKTKSNKHKATLKLLVRGGDVDEEKTLETIEDKEDLKKLFEYLKKNEDKFSGLTKDSTLVFEKVNGEWKHIKQLIEDWVKEKSGSSDTLKLKEGDADRKLYDWNNDEELKRLFYLLLRYEKLFTTIKTDESTPKPVLEFKRNGSIWKLIASQKTIEIWVKATSGGNATLKLWEGDKEKDLSTISDSGELEKILECLEKDEEKEKNRKLFSDLVNQSSKILVFEKTDKGWKHIRKALREWMEENAAGKFRVQIKNGDHEVLMDVDKDENLTGLLKHLKTDGSKYIAEGSSGTVTIKLQKKTDGTNGWEKAS